MQEGLPQGLEAYALSNQHSCLVTASWTEHALVRPNISATHAHSWPLIHAVLSMIFSFRPSNERLPVAHPISKSLQSPNLPTEALNALVCEQKVLFLCLCRWRPEENILEWNDERPVSHTNFSFLRLCDPNILLDHWYGLLRICPCWPGFQSPILNYQFRLGPVH